MSVPPKMTGSSVDSPLGGGAEALPPDARVGTVLAERYRIDAMLGEGGMGRVYAAEHVLMRKRLAVKVLHRELTTVPEVVARFEREAMAAANIEHPNVAAATDFGKLPDGAVFLVLEYVQGKNLRDEIAQGPFPVERALHVARQIASALGSAHALDIVHRDLKPENVMLVEKGNDSDFVKVLDFGIARVPIGEAPAPGSMQGGQPITKVGMVFGTPEYMAPEQALGTTVDGRADLYALGVILFEMLAGVRPFSSKSQVGILGQQLSQPAPKIADRGGIRVPAQVERIVQKLLAKEVGDRYQKAEDVIEDIGELLGSPAGRGPYRFTMVAGSPASTRGSRPSFGSVPEIGGSFASASRIAKEPSVRLPAARLPPLPQPPAPPALLPSAAETAWPFGEGSSSDSTEPLASDANAKLPGHRANEPLPEFAEQIPAPVGAGAPATLDRARDFIRQRMASLQLGPAMDAVDEWRRRLPTPVRRPLRRLSTAALIGTASAALVAAVVGIILVFSALSKTGAQERATPPAAEPITERPAGGARPSAGTAALEARVRAEPDNSALALDLVVALAGGKRMRNALTALDSAITKHPELVSDPRVSRVLFEAAQDPAASAEAFALLEGPMGQRGADVIYDLGISEATRKIARSRAERWLRSKNFAKVSSPALDIAMALRVAETCQQRYGLLLRAKNVGDERSLSQLESWKKPAGCGSKANQDCNPCLRTDDRLDQAIRAIEARRKG